MDQYLQPTEFFDYQHPAVAALTDSLVAGISAPLDQALALYAWVRDQVRYNPYTYVRSAESFRASYCLEAKQSYCIPKAVLLGAMARRCGIPSRLGLADVRNHLSSPQFVQLLGTDVFVMHGYIELYLNGQWVKATPAFDVQLCGKMGVSALAFDGINDSVFQPFNDHGQKHMEYMADHGTYADVPRDFIVDYVAQAYPHLAGKEGQWKELTLQQDLNALAG